MSMEIKIQDKVVGDGHHLFFIAEAGVNHNGSIELGKKLIDIAADSGADAVKFQTFKTENIITKTAPKSSYHIKTTGNDKTQSWFDLLKTQEMSNDMHIELIEYCRKKEIIFLSTPYDEESADLLENLDMPAFKIASTDLNNIPLLRHVARKGRPMIISTAMSNMQEVEEAIDSVRDEGLEDIILLQCTGNYPAQLEDSNLRVIQTYRDRFYCLVGYSDHTPDIINPIAATALGANLYEKHFTANKNLPGPDHQMSLDPYELKETIKVIRKTEIALGSSEKKFLVDEEENRLKLRKSIFTIIDVKKGQKLKRSMLGIMRPGNGISPDNIENVIGKVTCCDIPSGTLLKTDMFHNG